MVGFFSLCDKIHSQAQAAPCSGTPLSESWACSQLTGCKGSSSCT